MLFVVIGFKVICFVYILFMRCVNLSFTFLLASFTMILQIKMRKGSVHVVFMNQCA